MDPSQTPTRRDAVANRERIVDHAERVFASEGFEVSLHRIAKELGLGIGTVYRHFPTLDDLVLAIYHRVQDLVDEAVVRVEAIDDPFDRVVEFVDTTVRISLEHPIGRATAARVGARRPEAIRISPAVMIVQSAVAESQRLGRLRPDLHVTDVALLAGMLADLVRIPEPARSAALPRMRALVLDAMAPAGADRHDLTDPPMTPDTIRRIVHEKSET